MGRVGDLFNSYMRGPGAWSDRLNRWSGKLDNLSGATHNAFDIAYQSSVIAGKPIKAFANARDEVLFARLTLSATRIFTALEQLFTGKIFFQQNSDGTLKRDKNNKLVTQDFIDIAAGVSFLGGRILSPISWTFRVIRKNGGWEKLRSHQERVSVGLCVFFTIGTTFCGIKALKDLITSKSDGEKSFQALTDAGEPLVTVNNEIYKKVRDAIVNLIGAFLDLLAMPWENGVLILFDKTPPEVFLVGAIFGFLAHTYSLVKDIVKFDVKDTIGVPYQNSGD